MNISLFTGHRVDEPGRTPPRFPAHLAAAAAKRIASLLTPGLALSSLANGGDILLQEAALAAGLERHIVLPMPFERFVQRSVITAAPGDWERRARSIWAATPAANRHILDVPPSDNPFVACNDALLTLARSFGQEMRLIALWNGQDSGRPGGAGDMIAKARMAGIAVVVIDPAELGQTG